MTIPISLMADDGSQNAPISLLAGLGSESAPLVLTMAERGPTGEPGPPGPAGDAGPAGGALIGGYPAVLAGLSPGDHLEFNADAWGNVPRVTITDGGNF